MSFLRRLLGREELPEDVTLAPDERVLATGRLERGAQLVVTSHGLWLPAEQGARRIGWHLVSKASWQNGALTVVEAQEVETVGSAVLLTDLPPQRLRLAEPGRVPELVHVRVEGSIRSRHHRELPGGGAWFVQRKVPGRDGVVLQVRPDPGTDEGAVRQLAADVARSLGLA
ncbi:MAG TPA: hypothetical protein VD903_11580 [Pseudonocardia sp.]|nr:hypothetical protein [Pseudonocardia sp.]